MIKPTLIMHRSIRASAAGKAVSNRLSREAAGFTLIELLVSVSIMAIITLVFGGLLAKANQVVTEGEKRMRADATASAISRIIRGDIRRATKHGFFRISGNKLVLVIAGRMQSSFSDHSGDSAIIIYGRHAASNVLYRKVLILAKDATDVVDCLEWKGAGMGLTQLQLLNAADMTALIDQVSADPTNMAYPPVTLDQITGPNSEMWKVLAGNCTGLEIRYLLLFEKNNATGVADVSWKSSKTCTRHDQTDWPDAIKFKFTLKPGTIMTAAITNDKSSDDDVVYEIISALGH